MKPQPYLIEFIGTFFLVFTIGMVVIEPGGAGVLAPVAVACALMVMVYAGGHVSGAHYNPAVTLAVFLRGKCAARDVAPYVAAQCAAAAAAGALSLFLKPGAQITQLAPEVLPAMIVEFLFTFALCFVVLNVATAKATTGNSYFGLAIGITLLVGILASRPISGGAFNPAVVLGAGIMGLAKWSDLWIHLVGEVAGAIVAAALFRFAVKDAG